MVFLINAHQWVFLSGNDFDESSSPVRFGRIMLVSLPIVLFPYSHKIHRLCFHFSPLFPKIYRLCWSFYTESVSKNDNCEVYSYTVENLAKKKEYVEYMYVWGRD